MNIRSLLRSSENGQALLVVILVLVVAMTVGLSVATRSVTNTKLATQEEASKKAFSAAEAGIEESLRSKADSSGSFATGGDTSSFTTEVQTISGQVLINNGNPVPKDDGIDVWLSTYPDYTNPGAPRDLTIGWGRTDSTNCNTSTVPAIEVVVISGALNTPILTHYVYDPCASRRAVNGFDPAPGGNRTIGGQEFPFSITINNIANGRIARVVPLYANTPLGALGNPALPQQGDRIESTGSSGEAQRKIVVYRGYPKVPTEFFPYILFSP